MFSKLKLGNIKNDYYFDRRIGEGSFGVVYEARHRVTL
jgi:serine/threonine protein kinase